MIGLSQFTATVSLTVESLVAISLIVLAITVLLLGGLLFLVLTRSGGPLDGYHFSRRELLAAATSVRHLVANIVIFIVFATLFWGSFYILAKELKFSENNSLIAATIGTIPLLLLFIPLFEKLAGRLSGIKVAGVELQFAIEDAVAGKAGMPQLIPVWIDEHQRGLTKDTMTNFFGDVSQCSRQPHKHPIMIVDVGGELFISLLMLYFQLQIFEQLCQLRVVLFVDSQGRQARSLFLDPGEVLGSARSDRVREAIAEHIERIGDGRNSPPVSLNHIFRNSLRSPLHALGAEDIEQSIREAWNQFEKQTRQFTRFERERLIRENFREVLGNVIETNFITFPPDLIDYRELHRLVTSQASTVMFVKASHVVNVRTVDAVVREIAAQVIEAVLE